MNAQWFYRPLVAILFVTIFLSFLFNSYAGDLPGKIVTTKWLASNLDMKNLRIIDVQPNVKKYWPGHIPGAVYVNPESLRQTVDGTPALLIPPDEMANLLGSIGVTPNTNIVVYGETSDKFAGYMLWALDYLGHDSAAVLDGGINKWKSEGRTVSQDYPELQKTSYPTPNRPHDELKMTLNDIKNAIGKKGVVILDARPADLYTGKKGFWKRNGHIKGALSRPFSMDLNDDGTWKSKDELKKAYESLGVTPDKEIIVYCGQGLMSAPLYIALRHVLGYPDVKHFDDGYHVWSQDDSLPVETGMPVVKTNEKKPATLDGKQLVQKRCISCHNDSRIYNKKRDEKYWVKTIDRMIRKGATLNEKEKDAIIKHLVK
jgi:thiosulfate/3-mercaptopyruvate sulfurtransferase